MNQIRSFFSFKTVYSQNKTFLVFSIGRKEEINYSQVQMLENDAFRDYILPFQCTKTATTNKISFDVSGLTSLSEYLKTDMKQDQYFEIISGIQKIISFCQKSYLSIDNLICDTKYMYYHNTLKKILMLYIPVKKQHYICDSIPECLKKIHRSAKSVIITDGNYMNRYETYLERFAGSHQKNKTNSFSPDSLLHFFNENSAVKDDVGEKKNSADKADIRHEKFSISKQLISVPVDEEKSAPERFVPPVNESVQHTYSATVVRSRRDELFLTDRYGSRFDIRSFPFTIGRNDDNDLVVHESTVSGRHAVITEDCGRYFIKDESSNGTYLNDENNRISYAEINSGDKLFFDSFPYVFSVIKAEEPKESSSGTVMVSRRRQPERPAEPVSFPAQNIGNEQQYPTELATSPGQKALAYLRRTDDTVIRIMSLPYTDMSVLGITIYSENVNGRNAIFIKSISCNSLVFENSVVEYGMSAELFSGCSLTINSVKYTFFVEN